MPSSSYRESIAALSSVHCWNPNHPVSSHEKPKNECLSCLTAFVDAVVQKETKSATRDAVRAFGERVAKQLCILCSENVKMLGARPWVGKTQFLHIDENGVRECDASLVYELLGYNQ